MCTSAEQENAQISNILNRLDEEKEAFSLRQIIEDEQTRKCLFDTQDDGVLLTNIQVIIPDEAAAKAITELLSTSSLKKDSSKEMQTKLKNFHFDCCVSHGLVDIVETQQKSNLDFVHALPPHEQPNPFKLKVIYIYQLRNFLLCLHSFKPRQRQVDAVMKE